MNALLKQQWVEALRSGKYVQCRKEFRTNVGHCCLAVLCDVIDPSGWQANGAHKTSTEGFVDVLSDKRLSADGMVSTFVHLNDHKRFTFSQIADYIEANL